MGLLELAERVEAAPEADRELDGEIAVAVGHNFVCEPRYDGEQVRFGRRHPDGTEEYPGNGRWILVRSYTSSVDAGMALLDDYRQHDPDQCGYAPSVLRLHDGSGKADVHISPNGHMVHGSGATPALALTAAALRARHALALSKGSDV